MLSKEERTFRVHKLRPYQKEDAVFLSQLPSACCFNEQRTGKTPTALAACTLKGCKKVLIVCPTSALYVWAREYEYWTKRPCLVCRGTPAQRRKIISQWTDGLIISYDTFKSTKNSEGHITDILSRSPEAIILDEAHRIKDKDSANAKAVFSAINIPYRLALTGTPAPNKSHEVWSILHFIAPQQWPYYWPFINEYYVTTRRSGRNGSQFVDILYLKSTHKLLLQSAINKIATQRKRKDVMQWLPEKDKQRIYLPPTNEQRRYLQELQDYFATESVKTIGVLDRLIRYRQICLHPALLGLKGNSPKLEYIKDYIKDYPDTPTIVFSKFTSFIHLLEKELHCNFGVIVGATPAGKRQEYIDAFQRGDINLLLINIDAGKENLTLDRAETMIFTDKYPPAGDIAQAEDRFVSTTEDKADKPHKIIELVMKGTYDEQIYKLIDRRATESSVINDYKQYLKGEQHGNSSTVS